MTPINSTIVSDKALVSQQGQLDELLQSEASLIQDSTPPASNPVSPQLNSHLSEILQDSRPELTKFLDPGFFQSVSPAPTGGSGGTDPLSNFNSQVGGLNDQLQSAMSHLQSLDPNDPKYLQESTQDAMKIQQLQQQIQEIVTLMSNMLKFQHDTEMTILNNTKG